MGIIVFIINRTNLNANADAPYTSLYETRQHYPNNQAHVLKIPANRMGTCKCEEASWLALGELVSVVVVDVEVKVMDVDIDTKGITVVKGSDGNMLMEVFDFNNIIA